MAAKPARFKVGTSGSGKHTEVQGTGEGMGGPASAPAEMMPRIGAGVMAGRVMPEADRGSGGRPKVRNMKVYSEE